MAAKGAIVALLAGVAWATPRRLRIRNGCRQAPMWIAHMAADGLGPDPQNVRIDPLRTYAFATPDGLKAARFWPKMGCDGEGDHCGLGGSGGLGQACSADGNYSRCAPPVDTKFEATFGITGSPCDATSQQGCDSVDISLIDGYTLPFKLTMSGGQCTPNQEEVDCSGLTLDKCPGAEDMTPAGLATANLSAVNPHTGRIAGCYSPCMRLIDDKWGRKPHDFLDPPALPYCCPTPPSTPEGCRAGPIKDTAFVGLVHKACPGAHAYSYDTEAEAGNLKCSSATTYEVTFLCPATDLPGRLPPAPPLRVPALHKESLDKYMRGRASQASWQKRPSPVVAVRAAMQLQPPAPLAMSVQESIRKCSRVFEQCGGVGWRGARCCRAGSSCLPMMGGNFSQCRPDSTVIVMKDDTVSGGPVLPAAGVAGRRGPLVAAGAVGALALAAATAALAGLLRRGLLQREQTQNRQASTLYRTVTRPERRHAGLLSSLTPPQPGSPLAEGAA